MRYDGKEVLCEPIEAPLYGGAEANSREFSPTLTLSRSVASLSLVVGCHRWILNLENRLNSACRRIVHCVHRNFLLVINILRNVLILIYYNNLHG